MTHRKRFLSSMNFKQPDDMVAMFELEFHIYAEYVGEDPVVGYEYAKLSKKEKERAIGRNAEIIVEASHKAGHDAIRDIDSYWETAPGVPALLWLPDLSDRLAQLKAIKKLAGDEFSLICTGGGQVCSIPDGEHINDFVARIYEDPKSIHEEAEFALQNMLSTQRIMGEVGIDAVLNATDIAFNSATFLSPAQLDEFFFPYLTRWVEECKKDGLISILHTDGDVSSVMDRILASGVNALQCIDPLAGMDIVDLKKHVNGRLALIGNIDCSALQLGTHDEIDTLCKNVIEGCKYDGGFVFGGCNAIFKGISAENYQVMVDARDKYGRYLR